MMILATKSGTPIIGQVASVMGWIMDGIYKMLDGLFGVQNLGICIIIFSIIIYALMTPLQIKQQKFSKLSAFMQPELQKVQKKYQGKRDQVSMQKMNEETQAIYQKYGVSPTGSCVQLAIQFPILMALWQVIYKIPAYVGSVKDIFTEAVSHITAVDGYTQLVQNFITDNKITRVQLIMDGSQATSNSIIDFLYALSPSQWKELATVDQFSGFSGVIDTAAHEISKMQNFFGLNIADQPMTYIKADVYKRQPYPCCLYEIYSFRRDTLLPEYLSYPAHYSHKKYLFLCQISAPGNRNYGNPLTEWIQYTFRHLIILIS